MINSLTSNEAAFIVASHCDYLQKRTLNEVFRKRTRGTNAPIRTFPTEREGELAISKIASGNSVNGLILCPVVAIGYTYYTAKCFNPSKDAERIVHIMNLLVI